MTQSLESIGVQRARHCVVTSWRGGDDSWLTSEPADSYNMSTEISDYWRTWLRAPSMITAGLDNSWGLSATPVQEINC
ncbi:uncharacterized protein METZ01_LOCUS130283 [marine metagenome]|uniref:Uncharacterized protein n=1 Tax=marine metagenome TaxID=408172 RepID=A0A381YKB6_9ZZZZ